MGTIRQPHDEIKQPQFFNPKGRPVNLVLVTPVDTGRMPLWLDALLVQHGQRFDWGITFDARGIVKRLGLPDVELWGVATTREGLEVFASLPLHLEDGRLISHVADRLGLIYARGGTSFVIGQRGSWKVGRR